MLLICVAAAAASQCAPSKTLTVQLRTVPGSMQCTVTALPFGLERGT
jgi:hypothetical protein